MTQVAPYGLVKPMPRPKKRFRTTPWTWFTRSVESKKERLNRLIERLQRKAFEIDHEIFAAQEGFGNDRTVFSAVCRHERLVKKREKITRQIIAAQAALHKL